jgi:preprotein translocase subunit SecY
LPEVETPKRRLYLKSKLLWTGVVLILYFLLSMIPLYGLSPEYKARFEMLAVLLAAQFGSLITLGIGPIVTGSIVLQLLVGAEILKIDLKTPEGRNAYQGLQKAFTIFFIVFENAMYVLSGALPPSTPTGLNVVLLIVQLIAGGFLLMLLDEVVSKWGIGSGVSLFIAAGVSREIFVNAFSPMIDPVSGYSVGAVFRFFQLLASFPGAALWPLVSIIATILVFILSIYFQSIRVEIPLRFVRARGLAMRWPVNLFYTSNMPVILTAALIASLQFWGLMMYHAGFPLLGSYEKVYVAGGYREEPVSGLVRYLQPPDIGRLYRFGITSDDLISIAVYSTLMLTGCIIFSVLWISIGGQDPASVADQILSSGLSIPGFRRDRRILETILSKYILPLTIIGGFLVGLLAVFADLFGALSRGTGILLTVMILYQFYQEIMRFHLEDLHPALRKVLA